MLHNVPAIPTGFIYQKYRNHRWQVVGAQNTEFSNNNNNMTGIHKTSPISMYTNKYCTDK